MKTLATPEPAWEGQPFEVAVDFENLPHALTAASGAGGYGDEAQPLLGTQPVQLDGPLLNGFAETSLVVGVANHSAALTGGIIGRGSFALDL